MAEPSPGHLLERAEPLAVLQDAVRGARSGRGSLIFLGGEAGIGKTTLVKHLADTVEAAGETTLIGLCDPVETPIVHGPLVDIAAGMGSEFVAFIDSAPSPRHLFADVVRRLSSTSGPRLIVFEDVQWADQASVDLIRFLARRAERLHAAIVATFRDDEIAPSSTLAVLLGDLATAPGVSRLSVPPLSREATGMLVSGSGADAEHVYKRTGGNPFFINAVLAAGGADVPATVRDAVLARLARLRVETRAALEAAAVVGPRVDPAVLTAVLDRTGTPRWTMQDAVLTGLMSWREGHVVFRHELLQAAIAESIAAERRQHLHQLVLDALGIRGSDPATLVRHADGAGDDSAVASLAPMAAERAAARGAHREAAAFYRKAIDRVAAAAPLRAGLLEREAAQRYLGNDLRAAVDAHREAATIRRSCGGSTR